MNKTLWNYHAFISYSHADNKQQGRQWANWLHQAIESYQIPEDLVGTKNKTGNVIPSSIYPIFRDEDELPIHASLNQAITNALDTSNILIILCSPRASQSKWVNAEIKYFKEHSISNQIIPVIIDGEPNASWNTQNHTTQISAEDECFPTQLLYTNNGSSTYQRLEPLAADFRITDNGVKSQGWTSPEAYRQYLTKLKCSAKFVKAKVADYEKQQHLMLLKIIASILDVPPGELTQRDKQYQLEQERENAKRLKRWIVAISIISVIAIIALFTAWQQSNEASENLALALKQEEAAHDHKNSALSNESLILTTLARQNSLSGEYDVSQLLAINGVAGKYGGARPYIQPSHDQLTYSSFLQNNSLVLRHSGNVTVVNVSKYGQFIVTGTENSIANVWSASDGKLVYSFAHHARIDKAVFSPDGNRLLTIARDSTNIGNAVPNVYVWSTSTKELLHVFDHGFITDADFDYTSNRVVLYLRGEQKLDDNNMRIESSVSELWSVQSGLKIFEFVDNTSHNSTAITPNKQQILKAGKTGATLWSLKTGSAIRTYTTNKVVKRVYISPDGNICALFNQDNSITICSMFSHIELKNIQHHAPASETEILADTRQILLLNTDADNKVNLKIYPMEDEQPLNTGIQTLATQALTISQNGKWLLAKSMQNHYSLWSFYDNKKIHSFNGSLVGKPFIFGKTKPLIMSIKDQKLLVRNSKTLKPIKSYNHIGPIKSANMSEDDKKLIAITDNKQVTIWTIDKSEQPFDLWHNHPVTDAFFSIDGKFIYTITENSNKNATHIFKATGEAVRTVNHQQKIKKIIISDDNRYLITLFESSSEQNKVEVVSIETGKIINSLKGHRLGDIAFNHKKNTVQLLSYGYNYETYPVDSNKRILINSTGSFPYFISHNPNKQNFLIVAHNENVGGQNVSLYSADTEQSIKTIGHIYHRSVINSAVFSPDGNRILTTSADGSATLWAVSDGKAIESYRHGGEVTHGSFSPDGSMLLTLSKDEQPTLWLTETRQNLLKLNHKHPIKHAVFSNTGKYIVSTSEDNKINLWPLTITSEQAIKQLPINRTCLTPEERKFNSLSPLTNDQWIDRGCPQYAK